MIEWKQLRERPRLLHVMGLAGCALTACLLAAARFNGLQLPLNAAFAAALSPAGGIAVLAGSLATYALTGTLTRQPVLLCAIALTTIIRWILGVRQNPRTAAMLAAGSTFLAAIIFGMAGMVTGRDWLLWIFGSALAGGVAGCIRRVLARFENGLPVLLPEGDMPAFAVCYVLALAAICSLRVMTVGFGEMLAAFVILTAAKRYRMTGGVVCGTLSACALLLADANTAGYAAILPTAGFLIGYLAAKSAGVSYLAFQACGVVSLMLSQWNTAVSNAWVGGMIGGLIFLFVPAVQIADAVLQWSDSEADLAALTEARMDFLSHSIAGVRGSAERIANMMAKGESPADPAETVCKAICDQCRSHALCWESGDDETKECFQKLSKAGLKEDLRAPFGCVKPDLVTEEFSRMKRQNAVTKNLAARLRESQTLLFSQMRITEELLRRAGQQTRKTYHRELTRFVTDVLEKYDIPFHAAAVSTAENQRMLIEIYAPADAEVDTELVTECLHDALQKPLQCCGTERAGDEQRLILQTAGGYSVTTAAAQCAVHEDEPCGDCWDTFSDSDGAFYLAVSDGMGSGRHAAVDARIVLSNFRQLVQSGMDCKTAARIINAIMLTKSGEERFATLDVAKICTDTAAVTLYKYGAGPTFIKHGNRITLCQAATNPIGILPLAEPYTTVLKLERGDMLFLLTDGLDDSLYPYIRQRLQQGGDLQTLAHTVCAKAQRDAKGAPRDDVTVLAASISGTVIDE